MKIVVGLGNPGSQYRNTPHNVGFDVVDELALRFSCRMRRSLRFRARTGRAAADGEAFLLAEPLTYMNGSGEAVAAILRFYHVAAEDMVVVVDDADLPVGRLRVRG